MTLFSHHVSFKKIDPLANGLRDEIEAERLEPEAIVLQDEDGEKLTAFWQSVEKDIEKDPEWFHFSNDEG